MSFLIGTLSLLMLVISLFMILLVLIQRGRGGGLDPDRTPSCNPIIRRVLNLSVCPSGLFPNLVWGSRHWRGEGQAKSAVARSAPTGVLAIGR